MKKIILLIAFFAGLSLHSQNIWTEVAYPFASTNHIIKHFSIVDDNVVWVTGATNALQGFNYADTDFKTSTSTDGGQHWTANSINLASATGDFIITSLFALSSTTAYLTAAPKSVSQQGMGGVWITYDSGVTWTKQTTALFNNALSFPYFIHFWDADHGIVIGDPVENNGFEIYTTSNGGVTWTIVENTPVTFLDEYYWINDYNYFNATVSGDSIQFLTYYGRLYVSNDKGETWTTNQTPVPELYCDLIRCYVAHGNVGNHHSFITDRSSSYISTTDINIWNAVDPYPDNLRWVQIAEVPGSDTFFSLGYDNSQEIESRGSSYSTDFGATWTDIVTNPINILPIEVKFKSATTGYCYGYESDPANPGSYLRKFYRLNDHFSQLLHNSSFEPNLKISLLPNPTNGLIKVVGENIQEISIIDIQGKVLFTKTYAASNEINLDLGAFQNGVYFAKVLNDQGSRSTLKIIKK